MRDPARITKFFEELTQLWIEYCPDWRFGQLLSNWILAEGRDPFYWEEDKFIKELRKFMEKNCVVDPAWDNIFEEFLKKEKKMIIKIWLIITCLALGLFYANALHVKQKLKEKYPNAIFKKQSILDSFITFVQSVLMCACPLIHLLIIYTSIFKYDEIIDRAVRRVEQSIKEE